MFIYRAEAAVEVIEVEVVTVKVTEGVTPGEDPEAGEAAVAGADSKDHGVIIRVCIITILQNGAF